MLSYVDVILFASKCNYLVVCYFCTGVLADKQGFLPDKVRVLVQDVCSNMSFAGYPRKGFHMVLL